MNIFTQSNDMYYYEALKPILGTLLPSTNELEKYLRIGRRKHPDIEWVNYPVTFDSLIRYSDIKISITQQLSDSISSVYYTSRSQGLEWAFNCCGYLQPDNSLLFDTIMCTKCTSTTAISTQEMANTVYSHLYNKPSGVVMIGHTHPHSGGPTLSIGDIIAAVGNTNYLRNLPARHNAPIYVIHTMVTNNLFHMYFYDPMSNQVYRI